VRRKHLLHLAVGAAIAVVVIVPLGALAFIKSGIYDVGAARPHTKLTEWMTHETMIHSVRRHAAAEVDPPASFTSAEAAAGFCEYETHCVACHGASAIPRERWVSGQEPTPPYLLDAPRRFDRAALASSDLLPVNLDVQLAITTVLEAMPKMNAQDYARWRAQRRCGG
jgi:hypothetical protein